MKCFITIINTKLLNLSDSSCRILRSTRVEATLSTEKTVTRVACQRVSKEDYNVACEPQQSRHPENQKNNAKQVPICGVVATEIKIGDKHSATLCHRRNMSFTTATRGVVHRFGKDYVGDSNVHVGLSQARVQARWYAVKCWLCQHICVSREYA